METVALATRALETLREKGMAKDLLQDGSGRVCTRGAVIFAGCGTILGRRLTPENISLMNAVEEAIWTVVKQRYSDRCSVFKTKENGIPEFNNHPKTTQAEVEEVFEEAIALLELEAAAIAPVLAEEPTPVAPVADPVEATTPRPQELVSV